jgi:predicted SAM-dependent methyltransferase
MENHSKYIKLNLGCGSKVVEGWVNVDYSLGARIFKIPFFRILNRKFNFFNLDWDDRIFLYNLTREFPWEDSSVDVIYCSHLLEHFTRDQGLLFLNECYRVLKKTGILRIVLPDLRNIVEDYMKGKIFAESFVERLGVLYNDNKYGFRSKFAYFIEFPHKCMYGVNP